MVGGCAVLWGVLRCLCNTSHVSIVHGSCYCCSITDALAFALGSFTALPAVHFFCIYAALCILIDFGLQVTLVVAFLAIDERRQAGTVEGVSLHPHSAPCRLTAIAMVLCLTSQPVRHVLLLQAQAQEPQWRQRLRRWRGVG